MLVARSLYEDGRCISQMLLGVSVDRSCSTNQFYIRICAIIPSWAFSIKHVVFVRCFLTSYIEPDPDLILRPFNWQLANFARLSVAAY